MEGEIMSYKIKNEVFFEYARKAEEGDLQAQYDFAQCVIRDEVIDGNDKGMIENALHYLRNVAVNGACLGLGALELGGVYRNGKYDVQDYDQAILWFRTALQSSCLPAYYDIGLCFYYGHGVSQDYAKAFDSFLKWSADVSLIMLCDMYRKGEFVDKDERFAFMVYKKSYDDLINSSGENAPWYDIYWTLSLRLGECYLKGIGTEKNISEANKLFCQVKKDTREIHDWDKVNDYEAETIRLIEVMRSSPYEVNAVETVKEPEVEYFIEGGLIDLAVENLESYGTDDYLNAYFNTVKHLILRKGNNLVIYRNLLTIYPNLSCFEPDPIFIDICQKKISDLLEKENKNSD